MKRSLAVLALAIFACGCHFGPTKTEVGVKSDPPGAKIFVAKSTEPEVKPWPSNLGQGQQATTDTTIRLLWGKGVEYYKILVQYGDGTRSDAATIQRDAPTSEVNFKEGAEPAVTTGAPAK